MQKYRHKYKRPYQFGKVIYGIRKFAFNLVGPEQHYRKTFYINT